MATVYVQFNSDQHLKVVSVFASPQDPAYHQHLGEVEDSDPRYLEFMTRTGPNPELMALAEKDRRLSEAAIRIAPLQDAVDLDEATEPEVSLLKEWKQYRVSLGRLPEQPGFPDNIDWPALPS